MSILHLLAQAIPTTSTAAGATSAPTAPLTGMDAFHHWLDQNPAMPLLIGMILLMYFFIFRSKKTQDKKRKSMLEQLKRGDEIQTIGGIIGTVVEARDTEVVVKVDETSNTKMKFSRSAIHRVLEPKSKESKESK